MSRTYKHIYTKSKAEDKSCRNHGDCLYCRSNRLHQYIRIQQSANDKLKYYKNNYLAYASQEITSYAKIEMFKY